jgi:hypothetical protein
MLKVEKKFKKEKFNINPNTIWKIILCLALVLIFASFVFGFNLFEQINKGFSTPAEETKGQIKIVQKKRIEKVLEYFTEREKKSIEILNTPAPFVDPSL